MSLKLHFNWVFKTTSILQQAIEAKSFHFNPLDLHHGDVETGFQASDHVTEGELSIGGQEHMYLETLSALVTPKFENDEIEIVTGTQDLALLQVFSMHASFLICKLHQFGNISIYRVL